MYTVADLMTSNIETLPSTASIQQAMALMSEKHIRHIPVTDADGNLQGLVSHRDLLASSGPRLSLDDSAEASALPCLADIMTTTVETVDQHTSLRAAARYLVLHKYGCLPVTGEEKKLCGIITDSDFVNIAANLLEQMEEQEPEESF